MTDAGSQEDSGSKSVQAEFEDCPECTSIRPRGLDALRNFVGGGEQDPEGIYRLPDADAPFFDEAAAWMLIQGADRGDIGGAERATGHRWGDAALVPYVQRILERADARGEARVAELGRRYLNAVRGPS